MTSENTVWPQQDNDPINPSEYYYINDPDAIVTAAENRNGRLIQYLLNGGTSIEVRDDEGRTALMVAVKEFNYEIVEMLLSYGADVNALDNEGDSPLDVVLYYSRHDRTGAPKIIIDLLLAHGAQCYQSPCHKELVDDAIYDSIKNTNAARFWRLLRK